MSKATQAWGWKYLRIGFDRRWPHFVTRFLNDVGNYGLRGTFRERVVKGFGFWFRNRVWWKSGLHNLFAHFRYKRGIPYRPGELTYSQRARCTCGAGLAYWNAGYFLRDRVHESHGWTCAEILTGAIPVNDSGLYDRTARDLGVKGAPHLAKHDYLPFSFYEVRSEDQPASSAPRRKVLFGLLGDRYASCREVGDSTRFPRP